MNLDPLSPEISELSSIALLSFIIWLCYKGHVSDYEAKYSTFWPRFWAPSIDQLVLWPLVTFIPFLIVSSLNSSPIQVEYIYGISSLLYYPYSMYLHTAQGATVGKKVCKVRVVDAKNERPIKFRQALLREIIPALFIIGILIAGIIDYETGSETTLEWVGFTFAIWFILEIITMLTNRKRRALHDFIAGTVVVRADLWEQERGRRQQMRKERIFK